METSDVAEAVPILQRSMAALMRTIPDKGRPGSECRRAVGDLLANADVLLHADAAGGPMGDCFELARKAGTTLVQFERVVRPVTLAEAPVTLGGTLTKFSLIQFCLVAEARAIADYKFTSRNEVEVVRQVVNEVFAVCEEQAADDMDSATYRALIELHAAIQFHMTETARPLPRMLRFAFAAGLPTLVAGYRLYDDAERGDELRAENKVVHPAFMRRTGRALSA